MLDNIKKRGRDYEQKITHEYLENINKGYFEFIRGYPQQNNLVIELGELDFVENQEDYELIIDKIVKFAVKLPK